MKFILRNFLIFVIFIISYQGLCSQSLNIFRPDTTIDRGGLNYINFIFTPVNLSGKKLITEFTYNANVVDFKIADIKLINANAISISAENDLSDLNNAILRFTFEYSNNIAVTLFSIGCEGLAGADTVTTLQHFKTTLDDETINSTNLSGGKIVVRSSSVLPGIAEGLGQNRPNPFSDWTTFPFGINKESTISFAVYGLGGRKILDDNNIADIFKVQIINESGEMIEDYREKSFPRGNYRLSLQPYSWQLSSGTYFIVMKTESGVYKTNFMYVK